MYLSNPVMLSLSAKAMFELRRISEEEQFLYLDLLSNSFVLRHIAQERPFDKNEWRLFYDVKTGYFDSGYPVGSIYQQEVFVGWGGIQPFDSDLEFSLVLDPGHWGKAKNILNWFNSEYSSEMSRAKFIIPKSRKHLKIMSKLGYWKTGEVLYNGRDFSVFSRSR